MLYAKSIKAKNLFGQYDTEYQFNDDVSIVIGPNGCGKTILLKTLDSILSGHCTTENELMDSAEVSLSNGEVLTLENNQLVSDVQYFDYEFIPNAERLINFALENNRLNSEQRDLFINMVNKSFVLKSVKIIDNRLSITQKGKEIPFDVLSNGEKKILGLYLTLATTTNAILIFDEPETSMHIEAQESFVSNACICAKHNGLQVIIITHSPNIISGNLDLISESTVNLKG